MIIDDQRDVIALLSRPEVFGDGTEQVGRVQTHISEIFIGRTRVLKLKRGVTFPYVDFSTKDLRLKYCEAEVAVNRRTAPSLYRGVVAVTRDAEGALSLGGPGEVVDWLVDMNRFEEDSLFDHLAEAGKLDRHLMERLADNIATFHAHAEARTDGGGRAGTALTLEVNAKGFAENASEILDMARVKELTARSYDALDEASVLLENRRRGGCVRHCHGDMHLRNIFLSEDGEPVLFDAIEFYQVFTTIDVLYDLAFLLMDMEHRGLKVLASVTMNRYMDITGSGWGLAVLPLFLSMRAAVRSHVICAAIKSASGDTSAMEQDARDYLDMALAYLDTPEPRLVAVGGLSGSGKSRMGRELAPYLGAAPGARVVRSDVLRKRIAGVHPLDKLGPEGYTPEMNSKTYQAVYDEARIVLLTGQSVIADCVFSQPEERAAIAAVADELDVPFDGLWLEADAEVMKARVTKRTLNASDADAEVVAMQLGYDLGEIAWARIDSSGPGDDTTAKGLEILGLNP